MRHAVLLVLLAACGAPGDATTTTTTGTTTGDGSSTDTPTTSSTDPSDTTTSIDPTTTTSEATTSEATTTTTTGPAGPLLPDPGPSRYALVGEVVVLDGSASTGAVLYQWDPGDGGEPSEPSADPVLEVTYSEPGRFKPILTVYDQDGQSLAASVTITATDPPVWAPRASATVVRVGARVAVVSPDSDEIMIAAGDRRSFAVLARVPVGDNPRTLTAIGDDRLAVACQDDATLHLVAADGSASAVLALPPASRPFGVVADGATLYVSLQATGQLARVSAAADQPVLEDIWDVGPDARHVALLPDGRVAVARWRSDPAAATLWALDPTDGTSAAWSLQFDPQAASDTEVGGVPSYLGALAVAPTAREAAIPALQANIGEGLFLAGVPLQSDTTMRAVLAQLDPATGLEAFDRRKQLDNRGMASAAAYSRFGDYLYVATRGPRSVERIDVFSGDVAGNVFDVGLALEGLALSADDGLLFVDAYMSRELVVYSTEIFETPGPPLARLQIPTSEPLPAQVLRGKQLFNDSADPRLSQDNYIACAHCHLDGESDLFVWDFTDRGEGLRDTAVLNGHAGSGDGPIHWSANFDEVQDFENDIRNAFGGAGLMSDVDWQTGTRAETLGDPKAGVSPDLDALAAYVSSLASEPRSPHRTAAGALPPDAEAGRVLFESAALGCTDCHAGPRLTDSQWLAPGMPLLHDVGTLGPGSGQRLGQPLTGLDTPTLHGLWRSAPYLHDGSAATLLAVLTTKNPGDLHGVTSTLDAGELADLVAYLLCLDGDVD
jgi:hypothetical protein